MRIISDSVVSVLHAMCWINWFQVSAERAVQREHTGLEEEQWSYTNSSVTSSSMALHVHSPELSACKVVVWDMEVGGMDQKEN